MRTRRKVIFAITKALRKLDYIGVAIEPIPSTLDPENLIKGDYTLRVSFEVHLDEEKFFLKCFESAFVMRYLQTMPNEHFVLNMEAIHDAVKLFADDDSLDNARGVSTTTGMVSLGEFMTKLNNEVKP